MDSDKKEEASAKDEVVLKDCTFGFCGSAEEYFPAANPANEFPGQSGPRAGSVYRRRDRGRGVVPIFGFGREAPLFSEDAWAWCVIG